MAKRRDLLEEIPQDDPNYEVAKRFYLEGWADSYDGVAKAHAGSASLDEFVELCIGIFDRTAQTLVAVRDSTSIPAKIRTLDSIAKKCIRKFKQSLDPESKRLGEAAVEAAKEQFSQSVKEIASKSKVVMMKGELASMPARTPRPLGGNSFHGEFAEGAMDFSDLSRAAQDRIAAAEIEAKMILGRSKSPAKLARIRAENPLAKPENWRDGRIQDQKRFEQSLFEAAGRASVHQGRVGAARHQFDAAASEYVEDGKLSTEQFAAKLKEIGIWVCKKFRVRRALVSIWKDGWRIRALRKRAGTNSDVLSTAERSIVVQGAITRGSEAHAAPLTPQSDQAEVKPAEGGADTTNPRLPRSRKKDKRIQNLKKRVRDLRAQGLDHQSICQRLGTSERPPRATWRDFSWPVAYRKNTSAVTKWLSEACSDNRS